MAEVPENSILMKAITPIHVSVTRPALAPTNITAPSLNEEQRRSQISGGHRLIRLVREKRFRLYQQDEFLTKAVWIPAEYWLDHFLPALRVRMNETIAQRVNAAIARARTHATAYGVSKPGVAEFVAEAFFDNYWYKIREENISRRTLRDHVKQVLERGKRLRLHFPILSRKPLSPIKNRGPLPDLAEIHTLARCAEAAQVVNTLSPTGCVLTILADGFKYNRACRTPAPFVAAYQQGLRFWIEQLGMADVVNLVDYEDWVTNTLRPPLLDNRPGLYERYCRELTRTYGPLFAAADLSHSLNTMQQRDDIGAQLAYTFRSIVTSVYYEDLFDLAANTSLAERHYGDDVQKLYIAYVTSLHRPLGDLNWTGEQLSSHGYLPPDRRATLFRHLRQQAWQASIRYVAISLTDRDLNVLREIDPIAIKLTVHGKKGELHFLSATQEDAAMTAQHSTGGLGGKRGATKVTFRYRLERESQGEIPVLLQRLSPAQFHRVRYGPMHDMQAIDQPIGYVANAELIDCGMIHSVLTRRG